MDRIEWLRKQITGRLALARDIIESEAASPDWHELTSGVLVTGNPTVDDSWEGTHPIGDSRLTRFMEAHDPRDTIARCEAELATLDDLAAARLRQEAEREDFGEWVRGENLGPAPAREGPSPEVIPGLELAARHVASGYRHRPGYEEHWGAPASG